VITYTKSDFAFSHARPVLSATQKFVVPVPALADADPLVYPEGSERAGQPITDGKGKPMGEKGIVFFNQVDHCYQAAPADGRSVIIINEVTAEQALDLRDFVRALGGPDKLSKSAIERMLAHAQKDLGLVDIYNSADGFIRSKMTSVDEASTENGARPWGWFKRDGRDVCQAIFVRGPARFQGPAATPQQIPAHGGFVVRQDVGGKPNYRIVQAQVMLRTYMNVDGSPLELADFVDAGAAHGSQAHRQPLWSRARTNISRLFGPAT
jgi:hypothetical protein